MIKMMKTKKTDEFDKRVANKRGITYIRPSEVIDWHVPFREVQYKR
jgi:hypothetical protein